MPPKRKTQIAPVAKRSDSDIESDSPNEKEESGRKRNKRQEDDFVPSPSENEDGDADFKPSPSKKSGSREAGIASATASPKASSKSSAWSEADHITALSLMLGLSGDLNLTKQKKDLIGKALGRSDTAVHHWWNGKTRKQVTDLVARLIAEAKMAK
ncbi:hypothetical protein IE81DRAFT_345880 [Ceraceosorus guamensis]|uniref:Uncharacterized protein n=1 Tax=Ceraceosorus guamensis TaxID=1522189 RepID=A0A316W2Q7_9BASI|nr:hypothetical protein IE81DRAFT_345880 [Ceraceosorus guamensis]PWN44177.1 hypothetical protein IE81DRAFT_345880 [Ceraceosorus guamensis]